MKQREENWGVEQEVIVGHMVIVEGMEEFTPKGKQFINSSMWEITPSHVDNGHKNLTAHGSKQMEQLLP